MTCAKCFTDWISCGVESVVVNSGLSDGEITYYLDNKGATYSGTATVTDGSFTITEPYPGAWNPYSGPWGLRFEGCYSPLFCDEYPCIQFEIRNGGSDKDTINCCASGVDVLEAENDNFLIPE